MSEINNPAMSGSPRDTLELTYTRGGLVTQPAGATFGPRTMRDFELVWIIEGNVVYHADDQTVACPPGSITLSRPGMRQAFTWDAHQPTRHAYVHFEVEAWPASWPAPRQWPLVRAMPEGDVVRPLMRYVLSWCKRLALEQDAAAKGQAGGQWAMAALLEAYVHGPLTQTFEHEPDHPEPVQRVWRYVRQTLDEDPATPLKLADLAAAAAVTPEHLCRLFARSVNMGPMEMVQFMRLDRAVTLLAHSNLSVQQIADRCGFVSPNHFSRRFKQAYGHSPSEVRRRVAEGLPPPSSPLRRRTF